MTEKTIVIACKTLKDELARVQEEIGQHFSVYYLEPGLHNFPQKLHAVLQEALDSFDGKYATVLMAMGTCGNSVFGLNTGSFQLILPKVDDCISLLLGTVERRKQLSSEGIYFMTDGWLRGERNIWKEYQYALEKYGEKQGRMIFNMMFHNYRSIALIDTNSYDVEAANQAVADIAEKLELEHFVLPGTLNYLTQLLTGPYTPEQFFIVPPHSTLEDQIL